MSAFILKLIAVVFMIIDHTGAAFSNYLPFFLRELGRISFPIYIFFISEGCFYTKNIYKYMFRLGLFAIISEIPYDLALHSSYADLFSVSYLQQTNVFFTLFFGVCAIAAYKKISELQIPEWISALAGLIPAVLFAYVANYLDTDYSAYGVMLIYFTYVCKIKWLKLIVLAVGMIGLYGKGTVELLINSTVSWFETGQINLNIGSYKGEISLIGFALLAVVLLIFYNGKRGKNMKMFFYWVYPVHLAILAIARTIIYRI